MGNFINLFTTYIYTYKMFNNLKYNKQSLKRFKEILSVFFAQGFGYLIDETPLKKHIPYRERIKKTIIKDKDHTFPVRLRLAFEKLGPTFIKLGQILSLRPDLVPPEYIIEFEKMLDEVPTFSGKKAKEIVEKELKKPIDELFLSFDEKPIASASLAQVHKAILSNKKVVAVKVQRPHIREIIETDLEIMKYIAKIIDKHFKRFDFNFRTIVKEFSRWTETELNFYIEAVNAQKFRENFRNSKIIYIPKVYQKYTTPKVLTTELLDGIKFSDLNKKENKKINKDKIIGNGFEALILQVFKHGFFHADPHPGNFIALKDNRIGMVDFGIVGEFDKKLKHKALRIFNAIMNRDFKKIASGILALDPNNTSINRIDFERDLRYAVFPLQMESLENAKVTGPIITVLNIALKHGLKIPVDLILFGKTLVTVEGIAIKFAPKFQMRKESIRVINKLIHSNSWPKKLIEDIKSHSYELIEMEDAIPDYTKDVLERIRSGRVNVDIENKDVNSFVNEFEKFSGNLSFGIIIGALVIGSSLIFTLEAFRYLAVLGYSFSFILALWLIKRTVFAAKV